MKIRKRPGSELPAEPWFSIDQSTRSVYSMPAWRKTVWVIATPWGTTEPSVVPQAKVAAGEALRRAVSEAGPLRLEPIMHIEVVVPEEHLGGVIGDLKQRRAQIEDLTERGGLRVAEARVGLRQMFGYSTTVRSLSQGRAGYSMEPAGFREVSAEERKRLTFED